MIWMRISHPNFDRFLLIILSLSLLALSTPFHIAQFFAQRPHASLCIQRQSCVPLGRSQRGLALLGHIWRRHLESRASFSRVLSSFWRTWLLIILINKIKSLGYRVSFKCLVSQLNFSTEYVPRFLPRNTENRHSLRRNTALANQLPN